MKADLVYRLYLVMIPLGSFGGSHDTRRDCGELIRTFISPAGPGADKQRQEKLKKAQIKSKAYCANW